MSLHEKWGGPTVDVTILKEIYYSTYLPNDISCTGNDITVGCMIFQNGICTLFPLK